MRTIANLVAMVACLACTDAAAQDSTAPEWWGVATLGSHHFGTNENFKEINPGIGLEWQWRPRHAIAVGYFRNSVDHDSFYALYQYTPLQLGRFVRVGGMLGAVTGYPGYNGGGIAPGGGFILKAQGERLGANLVFLPKITGVTPNTLGLQVKYRFR